MLRDSTAIAVVCKRPQAIPLPMITMRKSIHEFLFPYVVMGLCLAVRATRAPLLLIINVTDILTMALTMRHIPCHYI